MLTIVNLPAAVYVFRHLWLLNDSPSPYERFLTSAIWLNTLSVLAVYVAAMIRNRVILEVDSIEIVGLFRTRRLAYAEIRAKRRIWPVLPTWFLYPRRPSERAMELKFYYNFDQVFWDWLAAIPMIDDASRKSLRAPRRTGATD